MTTLWTLFQDAIERFGDRIAVRDGGSSWTYAELDARVRGLAARLAESGVQTGDRVALLERNTPYFLEATFAVAAVGAVLQPLNHRLAAPELMAVLRDAETRILLFGAGFEGDCEALGGVVSVALQDTQPSAVPFDARATEPSDLAHLYYTSGTTGEPKGVMLTHRNVCSHASAAIQELGLRWQDRWGHFAPMFHLADAWATVAITAAGGTHVFEPAFSPEGALARIERDGVTLTNLIPTMLTSIVGHPAAQTFDPSSLRMILSGGAPIAPALVRRVIQTFRCEYVQTYGMTETSPYLTLSLLHAHLRDLPDEEALRYRARTGRPFSGIDLEVVDEGGARIPADDRSVGEIRVRGASVSPGYWRRPAETAAAFRAGWLYTGDLAVIDGEGYVNIVDRKKDMIITGGENVYSTQVEHVLAEHACVREVAVFGLPDEKWGERVCAAVVLHPGRSVTAADLTLWCRERIAAFKLPRLISFLSELPKTPTGKIAKAHLRRESRI